MRTIGVVGLGLAMLAGGCASPGGGAGGGRYAAGQFRAAGTLHTAAGADAGTVEAREVPGGVRILLAATSLPAGPHGAHVHAVGRCDAPDFASAGSHWNPTGRQHGQKNPMGQHLGDMPNLVVGPDGRGRLEFVLPGATLATLFDQDGAALVVHANPDDLTTDPSGNSGGRIACAVLQAL